MISLYETHNLSFLSLLNVKNGVIVIILFFSIFGWIVINLIVLIVIIINEQLRITLTRTSNEHLKVIQKDKFL